MGQETLNYSETISKDTRTLKNHKTFQTHNNVVIGASGNAYSLTWIDCDGYDKVAVTCSNNIAGAYGAIIVWSPDQSTTAGYEQIIPSGTGTANQGEVSVKARYLKVQVVNNDSVASHTFNSWVLLRA